MFDLWSNDFQKDAINLTPWKVLQCFLSGFSQIYQRRASVGHQVQVMSEPAGCYSISMQWSSKSMGNGYSMGLHHHPSLKHLHEFMYIDGEIVNTHIYHLDSFHYPFTSWPIANFGGLSKKITSIPAEARWDHIQQREACLVNMSQPIYDLIDISYWGECIHYNLDVLCVYIHRSIIAYIYIIMYTYIYI